MYKYSFRKNLVLLLLSLIISFSFSCSQNADEEELIIKTEEKQFTQNDVVIENGKPEDQYAYIRYSLSDFAEKEVTISFSAKMKVTNTGNSEARLMWQIMSESLGYPVIAEETFPKGTTDFTLVQGANETPLFLGANEVLYLSTHETTPANLKIEIKDIKYTVTYTTKNAANQIDWLSDDVPSLKDTYKDIFDSFGIACEYNNNELQNSNAVKGLVKHADSITTGNEFKPDFIFNWSLNGSTPTEKFTASNGLTIDVPKNLAGFSRMDSILSTVKNSGLKMRGHVLVWHSQTPDNFFAEGYNAKTSGELITNLVDKDTMSARMEWYIKTVLEHVAEWEKANNNGEHVVWAWDVVNEALEGSTSDWLRGQSSGTKNKSPSNGGSRWYQIYQSEEFLIDAFRYATAYAPSDVALCYNDFNEWYTSWGNQKPENICKLIDIINNADSKKINGKSVKPRIDAVGMQSHVGLDNPGVSNYEKAVKKYLDKGVDIHVTEFDISANSSASAANAYKEYFKLFAKYGKKYNGNNKITNVTVWGINNSKSWIYNSSKYPLLFENNKTTNSFWAVIEAAK